MAENAGDTLQIDPLLLAEGHGRHVSPLEMLADLASAPERAYTPPNGPIEHSEPTFAPVPPHILPEDSGVIRCICPYEDDDGFTIQCDGCFAWQHAICVDVDSEDVPERYLCHLCEPRPLNVELATVRQQRRLMGEDSRVLNNEAAEQRFQELNAQDLTEEENWETEPRPASAAISESPITGKPEPTHRKQSSTSPALLTHGKRKSIAGPDDVGPSPPAAKRKRSNKSQDIKGEATPPVRRRESRMQATVITQWPLTYQPPEMFNDKIAWKREYTPSQANIWTDEAVAKRAAAACEANEAEDRFVSGSLASFGKAVFKRRRRRATDPARVHAKLASNPVSMPPGYEETASLFAGPISPVKVNAMIPAIALEVRPIPSSAPTVLTPLSVAPFAGPMTGQQPSGACPFPRAPVYGAFLSANAEAGDFIAEYVGEVVSLAHLRQEACAQYQSLGVWKPFIRALPYPWSLAIDARRFGNETRFIRSVCHPNAVLRPLIVKSRSGDIQVHFGIFALFDLQKDEEVLLAWDWDDAHLVHLLPALFGVPAPSTQPALSDDLDTVALSESIAAIVLTLLGVTACACDRRKDCALGWLYKLGQVSQITPRGGMTKAEAFELAVTAATGGIEVNKKEKAKRSPKLPDLGPVVGMRRLWDGPPPKRKKAIKVKLSAPIAAISQVVPEILERPTEEPKSPAPHVEQLFAQPLTTVTIENGSETSGSDAKLDKRVESIPSTLAETQVAAPAEGSPAFERPAAQLERPPFPPAESTASEMEKTIEPAPPVSPPKPKLSLAAYRQRLSERKAEEASAAIEAPQLQPLTSPAVVTEEPLPISAASTPDDKAQGSASDDPGFIPLDMGEDDEDDEDASDVDATSGEENLPDQAAPLPSPPLRNTNQASMSSKSSNQFADQSAASYFPSVPKVDSAYVAHSPSPEPEYRRTSGPLSSEYRRSSIPSASFAVPPVLAPSEVKSSVSAGPDRSPVSPARFIHPDRTQHVNGANGTIEARRPSVEHHRSMPGPRDPPRNPAHSSPFSAYSSPAPLVSKVPGWQDTASLPPRESAPDWKQHPTKLPTGPRADRGMGRGRGSAFSRDAREPPPGRAPADWHPPNGRSAAPAASRPHDGYPVAPASARLYDGAPHAAGYAVRGYDGPPRASTHHRGGYSGSPAGYARDYDAAPQRVPPQQHVPVARQPPTGYSGHGPSSHQYAPTHRGRGGFGARIRGGPNRGGYAH